MTLKYFSLSGAALVALVGVSVSFAGPALAEPGIHPVDTGASTSAPASDAAPAATNSTAPADSAAPADTAAPADAAAPANAPAPAEAAAPSAAPAAPAEASASPAPNAASETSIVDLPNASETLASATVELKDGTSVGTVESVKMGDDGKPQQVKIDLGDSGKLGLAASDVSYDAGKKTLVASLTQSELKSLAAAQKQTH